MQPRYFPFYFRRTRGYARQLTRTLLELKQQGKDFDALAQAVISAVARDALSQPNMSVARLVEEGIITSDGMAAQTHAQYEIHGNHIFDIESSLTQALSHSHSGDLTISDLASPYGSFYLHFGVQQDLVFNGNIVFEGVYVLTDPASWRLVLCGRSTGPWWRYPAEVHTLRLPPSVFGLPLDQAIDMALDVDRIDLAQARQKLHADLSPGLPDSIDASVNILLQAHTLSTPALKAAMRLTAQTLAYMTAYPDDTREGWPVDTPSSLLVKTGPTVKPKERERNLSKLKSLGFLPVQHVGQAFAEAFHQSEQGHTISPHWRSGHWRHQPYGPQNSLRKLIWIHPTRVLGTATQVV